MTDTPSAPPSPPVLRRRGPLGWTLLVLGGLIGLIVLLLAGTFLFLQTGPGQRLLASEIGSLGSGPGSRIEVRDIDGLVPFRYAHRCHSAADNTGEWLAIDDARLSLSAADLLKARVTIHALSAASIRVPRLPPSAPPAKPAPAGPPNLNIKLPSLPVDIDLQKLSAPSIELGAPVLGQPARLALDGRVSLLAGKADIAVQLKRIDDQPGEATLQARYDGSRLDADLAVSEPTGTVLPSMLGRTDKLPMTLTLKGHGPLVGWRGRLDGRAGDARRSGRISGSTSKGRGSRSPSTGNWRRASYCRPISARWSATGHISRPPPPCRAAPSGSTG